MTHEVHGFPRALGEGDDGAEIGPRMQPGVDRPGLRLAVAEEIGREHAIAVAERVDERRPHLVRRPGAMGENDRRSAPDVLICDQPPIHDQRLEPITWMLELEWNNRHWYRRCFDFGRVA